MSSEELRQKLDLKEHSKCADAEGWRTHPSESAALHSYQPQESDGSAVMSLSATRRRIWVILIHLGDGRRHSLQVSVSMVCLMARAVGETHPL